MNNYVIDDIDISEFQPTQRQLLAKLKLHQYVPGNIIGGLTPETITNLRGYLYPITVDEILKWNIDNRVFWFWFTIPNEQATRLHSMKSSAVEAINNILSGDVPDAKLAGVQLKAAQLLLNLTDKPTTSVTNNNLTLPSADRVPRALKKKSQIELEEELRKLEAANNVD